MEEDLYETEGGSAGRAWLVPLTLAVLLVVIGLATVNVHFQKQEREDFDQTLRTVGEYSIEQEPSFMYLPLPPLPDPPSQ